MSQNVTKPLQQQVNRLTNQVNGLGLRRRGRRRRRGGNRSNILPGGIRLNDTEVLAVTDAATKMQAVEFAPTRSTLTRLDNEGNKFGRWSLIRVVINYIPTASLADTGTITYGILPGPINDTIKEEGDICKLKPFQKHSLWKSSSITVGNSVCIQRHLLVRKTNLNEDVVAFTLYISTTNRKMGVFRITYNVVLNYPKP